MTKIPARIVAISLLALTGCQSPGSTSGIFGGKDPAVAEKLDPAASKGDRNPLFAWNKKPNNAAQNPNLGKFSQDSALGPNSVEQELQRAQQAQSENRTIAAQSGYQKVLQLQPDNAEAHQGLAVILDQQGSFVEAEKHYLQALQAAPRNPDLLSNLGYSYLMQERLNEAQNALQAALEIEPRHRTALFNLGAVYAKQGNYEQALAVFREGGTEQQAQAALAKFASPTSNRGGQNQPLLTENATQRPEEPPANLNPATRKLWEDIQAERKAQEQRRLAIQGKKKSDSRISAPNPGHREGNGFQAAPEGTLTAEQRRRRALEYLSSGRKNPSEYNQLFTEIDQNAARQQALAESRHLHHPTNMGGNGFNPQAQQQYPPAATSQNFPSDSGNAGFPVASRGQPQPGSNWLMNPESAAQSGGTAGWGNPQGQMPPAYDPSQQRQLADGSGPSEWNPISTMDSTNGGGPETRTVSASRPISAPSVRPRITPQNSNPANGGWSNNTTTVQEPQYSGPLPPWTPGLQPASGTAAPGQWQGNTLPVPASGQDDFVPIPGQEPAISGAGRTQSAAGFNSRSQIQQVSGVRPTAPNSLSPQSAAPIPQNAWERARMQAAQMGLNAGPGSMFPVSESQGPEAPNPASASAPGASGQFPGNNWSTQPNAAFRQGPSHQEMTRGNVPTAGVPSAQSISYGDAGSIDASRARLMRSAATESGQRQLEYQHQTMRQTQIPSAAEQQNAANLWPGRAAPAGPQRLPVESLPADGGFPG